MKTAIVILNWNGKELLERFLPTVILYSEGLADIYIADNASTDTSIAYCQEYFSKKVTVIQNSANGGYAKGYNDALKHIPADLFVLVNSDVKVTEGWLTPVIKAFKEDPTIAVAQPKIKDLNKPSHFEYAGAAGGYLDSLGYPYCRGRIFEYCEEDKGQYNDIQEIQWASGACLFVKSDVFWEVGGLDEDFFAHQEEVDLCWRIKNLGYKIVAIGTSEVYHLGGATLSKSNPQKTFYNFRNTLFAIVKNVKGKRFIVLIFLRLKLDGIAGIKFLLEGQPKHLWAIVRAHFSFYRHLSQFLSKRKQTQKLHHYANTTSIIYQYFVLGRRCFTDILKKE